MSYLFHIDKSVVYPKVETLLVSPFKEIWERDTSSKKEFALKEFAYIEFMTSYLKSNPYRQYPEERKEGKIIEDIFKEEYKVDPLVIEAMDKIEEFQKEASTTYSYYLSVKNAIDKMTEFFNTIDITEKSPKTGLPIWKPADITRAINDTEKTLANLKALEKKVEEELYEELRTRGDKKISVFAKPESLKKL